MEAYAAEKGSTDEKLLHFCRYGPEFVKEIVKGQVKKTIRAIPEELKNEMAGMYGDIYYDYCAGNFMDRGNDFPPESLPSVGAVGSGQRIHEGHGADACGCQGGNA